MYAIIAGMCNICCCLLGSRN